MLNTTTTTESVYEMINENVDLIDGSRVIIRQAPTLVFDICSFCSVKNATHRAQEDGYTVVYKSSSMTYTKYRDGIAQAEGIITKCPVCGKDLLDEEEKWAPVPDRPQYLVSNKGEIKSFVQDPSGKIGIGGLNKQGYRYQNFKKGLGGAYVHDLVAYAFIPNDFDNLTCVNHKNHNRQDNSVENLEWCTYSYNNSGVDRTHYIQTNDWVAQLKDGKFIGFYPTLKAAADATGLSSMAIIQAVRGVMIYAGSYEWQLVKPLSREEKQHEYEEFMLQKDNALDSLTK